MRKTYLLSLIACIVMVGGLADCSRHRPVGGDANQGDSSVKDPSGMANPKCNPATVVNPNFLGAEGPDLPGAGGASGRRCRTN